MLGVTNNYNGVIMTNDNAQSDIVQAAHILGSALESGLGDIAAALVQLAESFKGAPGPGEPLSVAAAIQYAGNTVDEGLRELSRRLDNPDFSGDIATSLSEGADAIATALVGLIPETPRDGARG